MMNVVNVAVYQFAHVSLENLQQMKESWLAKSQSLDLKGTVLLSTEGVNAFFAGQRDQVDIFKAFMSHDTPFHDLIFKESLSQHQPFTRMLVRIKQEIIPLGLVDIDPRKQTGDYLAPETFKQWYEQDKPMLVLDTRNDYEVRLGRFQGAVHLNLKNFRQFTEQVRQLPPASTCQTVVMYCTGGIRCEKASTVMLQMGYQSVYQLDGGILNYFEKCGGAYYEGECFVFDKRVAVNYDLQETDTVLCFDCRAPIQLHEQRSDHQCPYCNGDTQAGARA
jgi:predicted sulfurtransferase